jgi:hypothetical protein
MTIVMLLGALELSGCDCNSNTNLDEGSSSSSTAADETSSTGLASTQTTSTSAGSSTSNAGDEVGGTTAASGGNDDQCHGTADCDEAFCVAPYADNDRGPFACVSECLGPMDEDSWCFDAASCCDPTAVCTIRGYCEAASADSSSSTTTDAGDGTSSSSTG